MKKKLIFILFCSLTIILFNSTSILQAQEIRAKVKINSERLGMEERSTFSTLEKQLTEFLNQTRWTERVYAANERIECSFTLNIASKDDKGFYNGEISITARRPVFETSYMTPLITWRDKQFNFKYQQFDNLEWNPSNINSNLVATIAYYAYLIIALDSDSFAPLSGTPFINTMQQIASNCQSQTDWKGWKAFDKNRNRYALAQALLDKKQEAFRTTWYKYHRLGLDEMIPKGVDEGRKNLFDSLKGLEAEYQASSLSPLLTLFSDTKIGEIKLILSKAPADQKNKVTEELKKIFPTADF